MIGEGTGEESFRRVSGQAGPGLRCEASGSLSSGRTFLFGHAMWLAGSWFLEQGLNPHPGQ